MHLSQNSTIEFNGPDGPLLPTPESILGAEIPCNQTRDASHFLYYYNVSFRMDAVPSPSAAFESPR